MTVLLLPIFISSCLIAVTFSLTRLGKFSAIFSNPLFYPLLLFFSLWYSCDTKVVMLANIFSHTVRSLSVCVFYVWPKTTLLFPVWPRDAKSLGTPGRLWLLVRSQCHNWVQRGSLLATLISDFKGPSILGMLWQRPRQWLNCVVWERGPVSPTWSIQPAPLLPLVEPLGLPSPAKFGSAEKACRTWAIGLVLPGLELVKSWDFQPRPAETSHWKRSECCTGLTLGPAWFSGVGGPGKHAELGFSDCVSRKGFCLEARWANPRMFGYIVRRKTKAPLWVKPILPSEREVPVPPKSLCVPPPQETV